MQTEVLQSFLGFFYEANAHEDFTAYSRSEQKKTLLLMHILITALILQGYQIGPHVCVQLRQAVKVTPVQFSAIYRYLQAVQRAIGVR